MKATTRTATKEDFKVGTTLVTSEGYDFTLRRKYDEGIWECNDRVHFENEARFYKVKNETNSDMTNFITITEEGNFKYSHVGDFIEAMERNGYALKNYNNNTRQREELLGMPVFQGLAGPMYDGGNIRYESKETNNHMSI